MERTGPRSIVQGGGEGVGYLVPRAIALQESKKFKPIIGLLFQQAAKTMKDLYARGSDLDASDLRLQIWSKELKERLHVLYQRRKGYVSEKKQGSEMGGVRIASDKEIEVNCINKVDENISWKDTNLGISCTSVRFIAKWPTTIEDACSLWTGGCDKRGFKPVKCFEKAEDRQKLLRNYSHSMWTKTGQKNLYLRYKTLMRTVASALHSSEGKQLDIFSEDKEMIWTAGIQAYHDAFDCNGKPISLSKSIRISNTAKRL